MRVASNVLTSLTRITIATMATGLVVAACLSRGAVAADPDGFTPLFDGRTFAGWNGDTAGTWRIEDGTIVAGRPGAAAPRNEFLATDREFGDFELRLEYRLDCTAACNAGIQFRSVRIPDHHEMIGFQADIGPGITGAIYDESRRRKMLAVPPVEVQERALVAGRDGWHEYVIRCEGPRARLWINGVETIDYTEADASIPLRGMVALQIHGQLVGTVRYRTIRIRELAAAR